MRRLIVFLTIVLLGSTLASAQHAVIAYCKLDRDLDFKTAKAGDKVTLRLSRDLVADGKSLMPKGTSITATVLEAKDNSVSLALDKATLRAGQDVALMGIIAAVAEPPADLSSDPFYGMNHSTEATQRAGNAATTSSGTSGAAAQTALLKGRNDDPSNLHEDSQGAIGLDGLKLTWVLDKPPATTVLTSKKKNYKLHSGTEVLLRMAPPSI